MSDLAAASVHVSLKSRAAALGERLAAIWRDTGVEGRTRRSAVFSITARVFNAGIVLLTHIMLARLLGVSGFGVFSLAATWVLALLGLATLGLTMTPQRFLPDYAASGDTARLAGLYRFSHVVPFAGGCAVFAAGALALWFWPWPFDADTKLAVLIALAALPALALVDVIEGFALANEWSDLAYGVTFILRPLLLPVLFAAWWLAGAASPAAAAAAFVLSAWTAAAVLTVLMRRRMGRADTARLYEPRRWFGLALPALFADGAFLAMAYADVLILSAYASTSEVGVYVAATKIVGLVAFIHFGLSYASAHHFAALHADGDTAALVAYGRKAAAWTFWPSLAVAGLVIAAAPLLLSLFGSAFAKGAAVMPLLLLALLARAAIGPSEQLLMMSDRQRAVTAIYGAAAALNILAAVALAPAFGAAGVAAAVLAASAFAAMATMICVRRAFGGWVTAFHLPRSQADTKHQLHTSNAP
jgi:O-antigen/teichoic acid export membrane protein